MENSAKRNTDIDVVSRSTVSTQSQQEDLSFPQTVSCGWSDHIDSGISMSMKETLEESGGSSTPIVTEEQTFQPAEEVSETEPQRTSLNSFGRFDSGYRSLEERIPKEIWAFVPNDEGDHVLHLAVAQENKTAILSAFDAMERNPVLRPCLNDRNDLGQTPLHIAVHTDQASLVKDLIYQGALLDIMDRNGNTPIHIACQKGHTRSLDAIATASVMQKIKEAAEKRNIHGMACPHLAAKRGDLTVLRWLHRVGVDMNIQESGSGRTALHLVTEKRSLPLLISLVTDFEVDVDVPTYAGYTPLHIAAGGDSMELVATLVAMGADPYALTDEVEKPEDLPQNAEVREFLCRITRSPKMNGLL